MHLCRLNKKSMEEVWLTLLKKQIFKTIKNYVLKNVHVLRITDIFMSKCTRKIFENWLKTHQEHYNHCLHADIFSHDRYNHIM